MQTHIRYILWVSVSFTLQKIKLKFLKLKKSNLIYLEKLRNIIKPIKNKEIKINIINKLRNMKNYFIQHLIFIIKIQKNIFLIFKTTNNFKNRMLRCMFASKT